MELLFAVQIANLRQSSCKWYLLDLRPRKRIFIDNLIVRDPCAMVHQHRSCIYCLYWRPSLQIPNLFITDKQNFNYSLGF